ncbi:hypothetical protein B0O99DRAFT_690659 [Bisporella sp. PMI_857]|nr:hypothetical protein B0O99DRAFT_690659 [Bisporella sp. PMI_857]
MATLDLDASLGNFFMFPREIRDMIWDFFIPKAFTSEPEQQHTPSQKKRGGSSSKPIDSLAILRVSRQIYEEATAYYGRETLTFSIVPNAIYGAWIRISNERRFDWFLESVSSHGFQNYPYHKAKKILVVIGAPVESDDEEGQELCLWYKVNDLVDTLSQFSGIRHLEIYLPAQCKATWLVKDHPRRVFSHTANHLQALDTERLFPMRWPALCDAIFLPFFRIRNVVRAKVTVEEDHVEINGRLTGKPRRGKDLVQSMMLPVPFGTASEQGIEKYRYLQFYDIWLKDMMEMLDMDFECALDFAEGETANMLRLRRCSLWYENTASLHNYRSAFLQKKSGPGFSGFQQPLYANAYTLANQAMRTRRLFVHALNPLSAKMMLMRHYVPKDPDQQLFLANFKDEWDLRKCIEAYNVLNEESLKDLKKPTKLGGRGKSKPIEIGRKNRKSKGLKRVVAAWDRSHGGISEDRWDRDEWYKFFPEGIEPLDTGISNILRLMTGEGWNFPKYMTEMHAIKWESLKILADKAIIPGQPAFDYASMKRASGQMMAEY